MTIHSNIQDAIKRSNLVFFVGSGFSRSLGLPNWTELVGIIADDLKKDYPMDAFISNIVDMIRQKYYTEIEALDKLKPKHLSRITGALEKHINIDLSTKDLSRHEKLWQITTEIVTTNYDKALETVAPEKCRTIVYEDDFHVAQLSGTERFLYKAHGSIERPAECVLFSEQYNKIYEGRAGAAVLELFRILSDKTIIFLGFSLNDPFVNKLLDLRKEAYKGYKQNHFIITTDDKDFSIYGAEKVEGVSNYGEDLDGFLDELIRIKDKYPYGLSMLLRGLEKEGIDYNEEEVRKNYFDLLAKLEKKPETAAIAEEVRAGEFDNAEERLKAELDAELQILTDSRKKAAEKAFELAKLKKLQLKYREALSYYQQAAELQPENSLYHNEWGLILNDLGEYRKGLEQYERSLEIDLKDLGEKHLDIALNYNNIGSAWLGLGKNDKALEFFERALTLTLELDGEDHSRIAIRYNNVGAAWFDSGNNTKAIEYYEKALDIELKEYGETHPNIAIRYNNLGTAWDAANDSGKAIEYHDNALAIDKKFYGEKHPRIAIRYNNIGAAWAGSGNYVKAIEYFEKGLSIDRLFYGEKHPTIARSHNNMGVTWYRLGDYVKAIQYHEEALTMRMEMLGNEHPDTQKTIDNLKGAREKLAENPPPTPL